MMSLWNTVMDYGYGFGEGLFWMACGLCRAHALTFGVNQGNVLL